MSLPYFHAIDGLWNGWDVRWYYEDVLHRHAIWFSRCWTFWFSFFDSINLVSILCWTFCSNFSDSANLLVFRCWIFCSKSSSAINFVSRFDRPSRHDVWHRCSCSSNLVSRFLTLSSSSCSRASSLLREFCNRLLVNMSIF